MKDVNHRAEDSSVTLTPSLSAQSSMRAAGEVQSPVLSITQLNAYVRAVLEGNSTLSSLYLRAEVSDFKRYPSGHCYFTLKDGAAQVSAVLFANAARRLRFSPQEGLRVVARGRVSLYEARGQYQVILDDMQPDGEGALYQQLEAVKKRLAAEGIIFAPERKKNIPQYPKKIAVVTSPEGAVIQDILQILSRRWPMAEVLLYPTTVQGFGSGEQITGAIYQASADGLADVLIVGRGGGSAEDLWSFNDECVARAVSDCNIPVISAVGHETDFTICDLAADLRAPTPSAAAELSTPNQAEEKSRINVLQASGKELCLQRLNIELEKLNRVRQALEPYHPKNSLQAANERLELLQEKISELAARALEKRTEKLSALAERVDALSPLKTLVRGYALVSKEGRYLSRGADILPEDDISLRMADAVVECKVKDINLEI